MGLLEALDLFAEHATETRRLSRRTIAGYTSDIKGFAGWLRGQEGLSGRIEEVTAADVERWIASRRHLSTPTVLRGLSALSSMFKLLQKRGIVGHNPVELVHRPGRPHHQPRALSEQQVTSMLRVVRDCRDKAMLLLLVGLGLRRGELLKLDGGDVDLHARRLHIRSGKGNKERVLPIPAEVQALLEQYLEEHPRAPNEPLFLSGHGRRLSRSALARLFGRWLEDAGLKGLGLSPHACRHFAATRWLGSGLTLPEVQMILGHSGVAVTGRYVHVEVHDIASKLDTVSVGTPPAEKSRAEDPVLDPAWYGILSRLTQEQRQALLSVARSMLADSTPSAAVPERGSGDETRIERETG